MGHVQILHSGGGCPELQSQGRWFLSLQSPENLLEDISTEGGCQVEEGGLSGLVGREVS